MITALHILDAVAVAEAIQPHAVRAAVWATAVVEVAVETKASIRTRRFWTSANAAPELIVHALVAVRGSTEEFGINGWGS